MGATAGKPPARTVKFDKRHQPMLDEKNPARVQMEEAKDRSGKPLLSLTAYEEQAAKTLGQLMLVMEQLDKEIQQDITLTNRLAGTTDYKGLHERLVDERDRLDGVIAEERQVRPLLVNAAVENHMVGGRDKELKAQVEYLTKYLEKRGVKVGLEPR
jgi:hypothetical protein